MEAWLLVLCTVVATLAVGGAAGYAYYVHKKRKLGMGIRNRVDYVSQSLMWGYLAKVLHPTIEDEYQTGNYVQVRGVKCLDCRTTSYLKLDMLPNVKARAKEMIDRYGTARCVTQMYFKLPILGQLIDKLEQLSGGHVLIASSVTSGHFAVIPVLVAPYFDALIVLDRRVHNSVTLSTQVCQGNTTMRLQHNDMAQLEGVLKKHRAAPVWYMCDGIYSMSGVGAPVEELVRLMRAYPNLHIYCDDAHGSMWCHPAGFFIGELFRLGVDIKEFGDRMIIGLALGKAFASGGGCFVFSGTRSMHTVRNCGPTLTFNTVINPAELGSALEICDMALRGELAPRQERLKKLIEFREAELQRLDCVRKGLIIPTPSISPITVVSFRHSKELEQVLEQRYSWLDGFGYGFFASTVVQRLQATGYLPNACGFPAVSIKDAGVRFSIHSEMSEKEVSDMLHAIEDAYKYTVEATFKDTHLEEYRSHFQTVLKSLDWENKPKPKYA